MRECNYKRLKATHHFSHELPHNRLYKRPSIILRVLAFYYAIPLTRHNKPVDKGIACVLLTRKSVNYSKVFPDPSHFNDAYTVLL